ncbi:MAG: PqqD family peptide modification chaperone [Pseudonocardiaceae bacterium]
MNGLSVPDGIKSVMSPEGAVLLDARVGRLVGLNPTGAVIWDRLRAGADTEQIAGELDRARDLLAAARLGQVSVHCGDGVAGAVSDAPFDRIVAWTTAPELPVSWIDQLAPDGLLVAPVALTPLSKTGASVVVALDGREPQGRVLFEAGYVEMHGQVLTQWDVPPYGADATRLDPRGRWWWLSAEHLRDTDSAVGAGLLDTLISDAHYVNGPLQTDESISDFRNWLLATSPAGLTTAALGTPLWRIGYSDPAGAALLNTIDGADMITSGGAHQQVVTAWVEDWRRMGRPGLDDLQPYLVRTTTGWLARARECPRRTR